MEIKTFRRLSYKKCPLVVLLSKFKISLSSSSSALSLGSPGSSGRWSRPGSAGEEDEDPDTWRATLPVLEDSLEPSTLSSMSGRQQQPLGGRSSGKRSSSSLLASARSRTPSEERKTSSKGLSELDRKVEQAARAARRQCRCESDDATATDAAAAADPNKSPDGKCAAGDKLKVRRLGGGKYNIAGRNVFVRVSQSVMHRSKKNCGYI